MGSLAYQNRSVEPMPRMRYWAAYKFIWTSPKGWMNLLMGGVCALIPIVGLLVLVGYLRDVLLSRLETLDDDSIGYPDFDFNHFGDYLMRGLWPFLVSLVATLVLMPVFLALVLIPMIAVPILNLTGAGLYVSLAVMGVLGLGVSVIVTILSVPLTLRAAILEEFGPSFSWPWIRDFTRQMWPEVLISSLFVLATAFPLALVGYAMCIIGIYPAIALMTIAQWHLHFQIYRIYLARGGERIPPKPMGARPPVFVPMTPPVAALAMPWGPMSGGAQPPPLPPKRPT